MIGDVNEDISDGMSKPIYNMFVSSGFTQHVVTPTRDGGTLIDHLYMLNVCDTNVKTEVVDCYYSDHDIVTSSIDVSNV